MTELEIKIQKYLEGTLSATETKQFQKEIEDNSELKKDIATYQEMMVLYNDEDWLLSKKEEDSEKSKHYRKNLLSAKGQKAISSIKNAETAFFALRKNKSNHKRNLLFAFICIVFLSIISLIYFSKSQKEAAVLYAENIDLITLPSLTSRNVENSLANGEKLYLDGNYKEAIALFNEHKNQNTEIYNPQLELYLGLSYLKSDFIDEAIKTFTSLIQANTLDNDNAMWFLSLAYLKSDQIEKCNEVLEDILSNTKNVNYNRAKKLQIDLKG